MLLCDDRTGSKDLVAPLRRLGCKAELLRMEAADAAFLGNGPGGRPHQVGIEVKTIDDVLQCIVSGRFAGDQLIKLMNTYDEAWLVIEGLWRAAEDGLLEIAKIIQCKEAHKQLLIWSPYNEGRRRWMLSTVIEWLLTMTRAKTKSAQLPLMLAFTIDRMDTVRFIAAEYHWWTDDVYEKHKALHTFVDYKRRVVARHDESQPAMMRRPTFLRRMVKEIPGLGWERSAEIEHMIGTLASQQLPVSNAHPQTSSSVQLFGRMLARAEPKDWMLPGAVARKGAAKIVRCIKENRSE